MAVASSQILTMTHVASAVITVTNTKSGNGTIPVATNRATQLRNQRIAAQAVKQPTINTSSNKQGLSIKDRVQIFEKKQDQQAPQLPQVNGTKRPSHDGTLSNSQRTGSITIEENHTLPKVQQRKVYAKTTPEKQSSFELILAESRVEETKPQQRYKNVPKRAPSIAIDVKPWLPGGKVVTEFNKEEAEKILAERQRLINEYESTKRTSEIEVIINDKATRTSEGVELRPLSVDWGDDISRESSGASLDVLFPHALDLARHNVRLLWKDVRGIMEIGLADNLDKDERTRQEAKFELMLSEGSFLQGLNNLKRHYMNNIYKHIPQVLTEEDYKTLFKHVDDVRDCSEAFLNDLNEVWQQDPMLNGIYNVITTHTRDHFGPYVKYCRHMLDMSMHLRELQAKNEAFSQLLKVLTSREGGQRLTLDAFLTAPMQRVTKLPLLLRTILDKTETGTEEHTQCVVAYESAGKIAHECDDVVNELKKLEEVLKLSQQIEFSDESKTIPIVLPGRSLTSQAYVKHFAFRDGAPRREKLHLILFSDLILVTKKKNERTFIVVDYCNRDQLSMKEMENPTLYGKEDSKQTNPVVFTMLNNSQDKKLDLVVTFKVQSLCKEWLAMLSKEEEQEEDESKVQEIMLAIEDHEPADNTELRFISGQYIRVITDEVDGWCEGELLSDGSKGRFPLAKTAKLTPVRNKTTADKNK